MTTVYGILDEHRDCPDPSAQLMGFTVPPPTGPLLAGPTRSMDILAPPCMFTPMSVNM